MNDPSGHPTPESEASLRMTWKGNGQGLVMGQEADAGGAEEVPRRWREVEGGGRMRKWEGGPTVILRYEKKGRSIECAKKCQRRSSSSSRRACVLNVN